MAKYLGVAQRTVTDYAKRKGMPKLRQDRYNLVDVRIWEIGRLKEEIAAQQYDQNRLTKANADEREHKADLMKMRKLRMEGQLIDRNEVQRGWIERIVAVKSGLQMLARAIAGRIEGDGVEKIVDEEVELCLERFAGKQARAGAK